MKERSESLRLALLALIVVLVLSAFGSLSLARDAFDADYDDCKQTTRLSAVDGLAVERTDADDEIRISWEALNTSDLVELSTNVLKARLTVIVEGGGVDDAMNVALGDTSLVIDGVEFTKDLTVSLAVTLGNYVISDIAEAEFTSGMPAPTFATGILANVADADDVDKDSDLTELIPNGVDYGDFYYLGFNDLFDNWYVADRGTAEIETRPTSPKFRVGLRHGNEDLAPADADFDYYRIAIHDSNGDSLGYQARSVSSSSTYSANVITFGETPVENGVLAGDAMSNIRLSKRADNGPRDPYYNDSRFTASPTSAGISYGNVIAVTTTTTGNTAPAANVLYANPPLEWFDYPKDVFEGDGNYTISAWAENDDRTRISPQASVVLSVQEGANITGSNFQGYGTDGARDFEGEGTLNVVLAKLGLSIQDN